MAVMDFAAVANGGVLTTQNWGGKVTIENPSYVNDGNDNTYSKAYVKSDEACYGATWYIALGPAHIDSFSFKVFGDDYGYRDPWIYMYYRTYGQNWTLLERINPLTDGEHIYTYSAGYEDVTDIRLDASMCRDNRWLLWDLVPSVRVYYMKATGENTDSGLRVRKGTTSYKLAQETLVETEHKLRFRKGSTTYGIPLVKPESPIASPLRIAVAEDEILCPRLYVE